MKRILILLIFVSTTSYAQTGLLLKRYYITGSLSVGKDSGGFADSSAWLQVGTDTTDRGILFPKVLLDSVATAMRGLYVYDLKDSVLYHFDGNKKVRYMTYKDTILIKQLIVNNPPDLSNYFSHGGDVFGATAVFGTNDNKGMNFIVDDTVAVSISDKRVWTKQGRTESSSGINLNIGTGYELYSLNHASEGYLTYISGFNGDFSSGYGLVFGKPSNKIVKLTDAQIQLNQNVVLGGGKTIQAGNTQTFESSPYTGLKYTSSSGWHFAIRNSLDENKLIVNNIGNVLINTNTDAGYKLNVNGSARVADETYIEKKLTFQNNTLGIQIQDGNTIGMTTSILIGRNNGSYPTTGNRHIKK